MRIHLDDMLGLILSRTALEKPFKDKYGLEEDEINKIINKVEQGNFDIKGRNIPKPAIKKNKLLGKEEKICKYCKEPFIALRKDKIFCSSSCQKKDYRIRNKAKIKRYWENWYKKNKKLVSEQNKRRYAEKVRGEA